MSRSIDVSPSSCDISSCFQRDAFWLPLLASHRYNDELNFVFLSRRRSADHLALMMELLGQVPVEMTRDGRYSSSFFGENGDLLHIYSLKYWCIQDVLREKYKFSPGDAEDLSNFLLPMLAFSPSRRCTAREALNHPFLNLEHPRQDQPFLRRSNSHNPTRSNSVGTATWLLEN